MCLATSSVWYINTHCISPKQLWLNYSEWPRFRGLTNSNRTHLQDLNSTLFALLASKEHTTQQRNTVQNINERIPVDETYYFKARKSIWLWLDTKFKRGSYTTRIIRIKSSILISLAIFVMRSLQKYN